MIARLITIITMSACLTAQAQPLPDFAFKSPAFNGNGYSSHVLTIENLQHTRKEAIQKEIEAALEKEKNDAKNTNISKFMNNLESRIYAQISQNLATAMFAEGGSNSGTLDFEGNMINWTKSSTEITLQVTDYLGNATTVSIPLGSFQF
jgi:curli production assembly/transport component CsgF